MPEPAAIDALLGWLGKQSITDVFSCDYLAEQFAPASAYPEIASGIITTIFTSDMRNCVVWLRKEKLRTVKWAGSYEQGLVQTQAGDFRLSYSALKKNGAWWKNICLPGRISQQTLLSLQNNH